MLQKSCVHQLRLVVYHPIIFIYRVLAPFQVVIAGFLATIVAGANRKGAMNRAMGDISNPES